MRQQITAVLFDLDGTLLENNVPVFFGDYFRRLAGWMAELAPEQKFLHWLNKATDAMLANDGECTNEEAFWAEFETGLGIARETIEPVFLDYYARDYVKLREHTARRQEARAVVQLAFDLGLDVVVATNPLFPETANRQRLAWAGVADFPYRLITSYDNSRACKPNLTYYRQIAETLGRDPRECLMVGDEDWDMVAGHLGCLTYLVPGINTKPTIPDAPEPQYRGTLGELAEVLKRHIAV